MHIELRHLKTIRAIHEQGSLARAADVLHITQSALSHQIKALEDQTGVDLFVRRSKPMRLSAAGVKFLRLADEVLPRVDALVTEFASLRSGQSGRLHIAIECHACFDWLLPVLDVFRRSWPDVDVDIRPGLQFDALPALTRHAVDLVISSDPEDVPDTQFIPLFDYESVFICAANHPLAQKPWIDAADFADQVLLTYPVDRARLDAFNQLLIPAGVEPQAIRQVELSAVILLLVASGRGVAVLPDWVVRDLGKTSSIKVKPLTKHGITRRLYGAIRAEDAQKPYMAQILRLCRSEPPKLQRKTR